MSAPFTNSICDRRRMNHESVDVCIERLSTRAAMVSPRKESSALT